MNNKSTKKDILEKILTKNPNYSKKAVSEFYNMIFEEITEELLKENNVNIRNFGTFEIRERKAKIIKSIDGTITTVPEHKTVVFTLHKELKNKLKN